MTLKTVLTLNSIVAMPFGVLFSLFPSFLLGSVYGAELHPTGVMLARMLGGEFLCFGVMTWNGRKGSEETQYLLALGCFIGFSVGAAALLWGQLVGVFNTLGWSMFATYAFFSAAYLVLYRNRPPRQEPRRPSAANG